MPNKGYCDCSTEDFDNNKWCGYCLAQASKNHESAEHLFDVPRVPRIQNGTEYGLVDPDMYRDTEGFLGLSDFEVSLPGTSEEDLTGGSSNYYQLPKDAKEIADLIEHKDMSFNVGNIFKAAYRLGDKKGTTALYDIEKILWFAQRELDRVKK